MTITLSNWVYEGIVNERSLLTMHTDYFLLTGGLERALYRIARKHAGNQPDGWTCRIEVLYEKTGSDSQPKEFNRMLRKVVERNQLPEYALSFTKTQDDSPALHVVHRDAADISAIKAELAALNEG
jgi:plasmid replication initiation protein